jgi:hypothetical protein
MRPELPIALNLPTVGRLDFRVSSNSMTHDDRFRVVYYLPSNAKTMHQCAHWFEAAGANAVSTTRYATIEVRNIAVHPHD